MNYQLDLKSKQPAYMQLYQLLRRDIVSGVYPLGSKLPSKRSIAAEIGISVITVEHAVDLLCEEGYVESRIRSGYYVIFQKDDFQSALSPVRDFVQPWLQPMDAGDFPYSVLSKTMRRVMLDYGEQILERSPFMGNTFLRREICAYLARSRGMNIHMEQLVIGAGAEYLYGMIAQMLGGGTKIALEDPGYDKIEKVYRAFGLACEKIPLHSEGLDSFALQKTDARVLHTTPFHSYPSGISVGISKKLEYLAWARDRKGFIIEDNYDSELTVSRKAEESLYTMAKDQDVIYLNTFSRTIAPSIRIGYMVLPENFIEEFQDKLGFYSCTVPAFEQFVVAELLRSGDFERHINRVRRKKRRENK